MQITIKVEGLICRFVCETINTAGCCWRWKLDPYKVTNFTRQDILVNLVETVSDRSIFLGQDSLILTEPSGFFQHQIFRQCNRVIWRYVRNRSNKVCLSYEVDLRQQQIFLLEDYTNSAGSLAFEYLGQIMPCIFLKHHLLTLHSALVEYNGRSFAICAPSGTGKTTHARLWRDCKNALILNGDRAVIGKTEQGWTAYGTPWSGTSGEQINRHAPLHALVILERSEENSVEKLEGLQAFVGMMPHMLYPAWDRELAEIAIDGLNDMLSSIPVYRLCCRPEKEAVEVLYQALYEG